MKIKKGFVRSLPVEDVWHLFCLNLLMNILKLLFYGNWEGAITVDQCLLDKGGVMIMIIIRKYSLLWFIVDEVYTQIDQRAMKCFIFFGLFLPLGTGVGDCCHMFLTSI